MAKIVKINQIYNKYNYSANRIKAGYKPMAVTSLSGKGETHNNPSKSSNNENYLVDIFYTRVHNLKASYQRLSDEDTANTYYKTHKQEILSGGQSLVRAINDLIDEAKEKDIRYNTHYEFLVIAEIHDNEEPLSDIGIYFYRDKLHYDKNRFMNTFLDDISKFAFLFDKNGLIEKLIQLHYKLLSLEDDFISEGNIVDLKA